MWGVELTFSLFKVDEDFPFECGTAESFMGDWLMRRDYRGQTGGAELIKLKMDYTLDRHRMTTYIRISSFKERRMNEEKFSNEKLEFSSICDSFLIEILLHFFSVFILQFAGASSSENLKDWICQHVYEYFRSTSRIYGPKLRSRGVVFYQPRQKRREENSFRI